MDLRNFCTEEEKNKREMELFFNKMKLKEEKRRDAILEISNSIKNIENVITEFVEMIKKERSNDGDRNI